MKDAVSLDSLAINVLKFPKAYHYFSMINAKPPACQPIGRMLIIVSMFQLLLTGFLPIYLNALRNGQRTMVSDLFVASVTFAMNPDSTNRGAVTLGIVYTIILSVFLANGLSYWSFCRSCEVSSVIRHTRGGLCFYAGPFCTIPLIFVMMRGLGKDSDARTSVLLDNWFVQRIMFCSVFVLEYILSPLIVGSPLIGGGHMHSRLVPDGALIKAHSFYMIIWLGSLLWDVPESAYCFLGMSVLFSVYHTMAFWRYPPLHSLDETLDITYFVMQGITPLLSTLHLFFSEYFSETSLLVSLVILMIVVFRVSYCASKGRRRKIVRQLATGQPMEMHSKEELMTICQIAVSEDRISTSLLKQMELESVRLNDPDIVLVLIYLRMNEKNDPSRDLVDALVTLVKFSTGSWCGNFAAYQLLKLFTRGSEIISSMPIVDNLDQRIGAYISKRDRYWSAVITGQSRKALQINDEMTEELQQLRFDYLIMKSFYDMHPRIDYLNRMFFYEEFARVEDDPMMAITARIKNSRIVATEGTMMAWAVFVMLLMLALMIYMLLPFMELNTLAYRLSPTPETVVQSVRITRHWADISKISIGLIDRRDEMLQNVTLMRDLEMIVANASAAINRGMEALMLADSQAGLESKKYEPWFMAMTSNRLYKSNKEVNISVYALLRVNIERVERFLNPKQRTIETDENWVLGFYLRSNDVLKMISACSNVFFSQILPKAFVGDHFQLVSYLVLGFFYAVLSDIVTIYLSIKLGNNSRSKRPHKHPNVEYSDVVYSPTTESMGVGRGLRRLCLPMGFTFMVIALSYLCFGAMKSEEVRLHDNVMLMDRMASYYVNSLLYWLSSIEVTIRPFLMTEIDLRSIRESLVEIDTDLCKILGAGSVKFTRDNRSLDKPSSTDSSHEMSWRAFNQLREFTYVALTREFYDVEQYTQEIVEQISDDLLELELRLQAECWATELSIMFYFRMEIVILVVALLINCFVCTTLILSVTWRQSTAFHSTLSLSPVFIASDQNLMELVCGAPNDEKLDRSRVFLCLLEDLELPILVVNRALAIVAFTRSVQTLFGYKYEQLVGQELEVIIPKSNRSSTDNSALFYAQLAERISFRLPLVSGRSSNNVSMPLSVRVSPIDDFCVIEFVSMAGEIAHHEMIEQHRRLMNRFETAIIPKRQIPEIMDSAFAISRAFQEGTLVLVGFERSSARASLTSDSLRSMRKDLAYSIEYFTDKDSAFLIEASSGYVIAAFMIDASPEHHAQRAIDFVHSCFHNCECPSFGIAITMDNPEIVAFPIPSLVSQPVTTTLELISPGAVLRIMQLTVLSSRGKCLVDDRVRSNITNHIEDLSEQHV